jgi:hypothetical protein
MKTGRWRRTISGSTVSHACGIESVVSTKKSISPAVDKKGKMPIKQLKRKKI